MNLVFIGFKNCGKTSVGRALADKLKKPFFDTDELVEKKYHKKVKAIFAEQGEIKFRQIEKKVIKELMGIENSIVSVGGGAIFNPDSLASLRRIGRLIYLYAPFETLKERTRKRNFAFLGRLNFDHEFFLLHEERKVFYEAVADVAIDSTDCSVEQLVDKVIKVIYGE